MQLTPELSIILSDAWAWVNSHSNNVERPHEVNRQVTVRDELASSIRGRCRMLLNLCVDPLHKLDYGGRKRDKG